MIAQELTPASGNVGYRPRASDVVLDRSSSVPLYLQLEQHLVHLISSGTWRPDTNVPSVRQLAADLRVATATVQRVYNDLQAQGLLIGRAGRGVFVADLASGAPPQSEERREILRGLLARPVAHARSLGFADSEVLETIERLTDSPVMLAGPPHVVFVGTSAASVRKYVALLGDALRPLGLAVDGILSTALAQDECVLDRFEPIRMIVGLVGIFADLREVAARRGAPVYGLVIDLAEETQEALINLPPDGTVALVGPQRFLPSARALLRQYFIADERVRWTVPTNTAMVRRLVRSSPIVVHTLAAAEVVHQYALPSTRVIELLYRPNPASLTRLRSFLAEETTA